MPLRVISQSRNHHGCWSGEPSGAHEGAYAGAHEGSEFSVGERWRLKLVFRSPICVASASGVNVGIASSMIAAVTRCTPSENCNYIERNHTQTSEDALGTEYTLGWVTRALFELLGGSVPCSRLPWQCCLSVHPLWKCYQLGQYFHQWLSHKCSKLQKRQR